MQADTPSKKTESESVLKLIFFDSQQISINVLSFGLKSGQIGFCLRQNSVLLFPHLQRQEHHSLHWHDCGDEGENVKSLARCLLMESVPQMSCPGFLRRGGEEGREKEKGFVGGPSLSKSYSHVLFLVTLVVCC